MPDRPRPLAGEGLNERMHGMKGEGLCRGVSQQGPHPTELAATERNGVLALSRKRARANSATRYACCNLAPAREPANEPLRQPNETYCYSAVTPAALIGPAHFRISLSTNVCR